MQIRSGQAPQIETSTRLYYGDELFTPSGFPMTDASVALDRDLREREKLEELAAQVPGPVVTMYERPEKLGPSYIMTRAPPGPPLPHPPPWPPPVLPLPISRTELA